MTSRQQGEVAEHLVCVDLLKQGFDVSQAGVNLRYDLLVDVGGKILRVQVKSTITTKYAGNSKFEVYCFGLRSINQKAISTGEVDIVALVAIDIGVVGYMPASKCGGRSIMIRPPNAAGEKWTSRSYYIDKLPFKQVLQEIQDEDSE